MRTVVAVLYLASQAAPAFDVVSLKPGDPASPESSIHYYPGRAEFKNATLRSLILLAYGIQDYQLSGGPSWMNTAPFDLIAKWQPTFTQKQLPEMLQPFLTDRFALQTHRDSRPTKGYTLTVAKGGPKLTPASEQDVARPSESSGSRELKMRAAAIGDFVRLLSRVLGSPVVDQTALAGRYTIELQFARPEGAPTEADAQLPSIFSAIQQNLGLRLETAQVPLEVLIADRAERPAAN